MGALADKQFRHANALRLKILDLFDQHRGINHHAVANHIHCAGIENTRRHDMQLERAALVDDRMAGIIPTAIADHQPRTLGQQIDNMTLALVAPLGTNYCDDWHSMPPSDNTDADSIIA